jgi:hypothetical protein
MTLLLSLLVAALRSEFLWHPPATRQSEIRSSFPYRRNMNAVHISEIEVEMFDLSIDLACYLQRRERLARIEDLLERKDAVLADKPTGDRRSGPLYGRRADGCLVVSFDSGWYPFLDDSMGYNRPETRCWYCPKNPVLDHVVEAMQDLNLPQSGGRAFLHANGAMRAGNIELIRWDLAVPSRFLLNLR